MNKLTALSVSPMMAALTLALSTNPVMAADSSNSNKLNNPQKITINSSMTKISNLTLGTDVKADTNAVLTRVLNNIAAKKPAFTLQGNEDFTVVRQWQDKQQQQHLHVQQSINGLTVYGTSLIVHSQLSQNDSVSKSAKINNSQNATVYALSGKLAIAPELTSKTLSGDIDAITTKIATSASKVGQVNTKPELAYVYLPQSDSTHLAFRLEVSWKANASEFGKDWFFYDAQTGELLTRHAQYHSSKSWSTHDLLNQFPRDASELPGPVICVNEQSCGDDQSAQRAHDGASAVYDYYLEKFGRKGIDDNDMPSVSSVHLGENIANAFWTGSQMIYGDGDGVFLNDLTLAPDVIGHELTHGVTQYTAGLIYANASGALNEAFSDILGVTAKAYMLNSSQPSWKLGEEAIAPAFPRDAVRYMDNPTKDGYSRDWWPERIPYVAFPDNGNDFGGVHGNSGIANLAFVLITDGGLHPREKSAIEVHKLGMAKAEQIYYRALSTYLINNSNFFDAKAATAQAAADLYGPIEVHAVHQSWCAVGVDSQSCELAPACDVEPWDANIAYWGGQRAKVGGLVYEAKWWSQAQDPSANNADWYEWKVAQECLIK